MKREGFILIFIFMVLSVQIPHGMSLDQQLMIEPGTHLRYNVTYSTNETELVYMTGDVIEIKVTAVNQSTAQNHSTYTYDFLINDYLVGEFTEYVYKNLSDFGNWVVSSDFDVFLTDMRVNYADANLWSIGRARTVTIIDGIRQDTYEYSEFGILMVIITEIEDEMVLKIEKEVSSTIFGFPPAMILIFIVGGVFGLIFKMKNRNRERF